MRKKRNNFPSLQIKRLMQNMVLHKPFFYKASQGTRSVPCRVHKTPDLKKSSVYAVGDGFPVPPPLCFYKTKRFKTIVSWREAKRLPYRVHETPDLKKSPVYAVGDGFPVPPPTFL